MVAVSVAADSARIDSMDTAANVTSIGGGAGAAAEPDVFYQGSGSVSRKIGTASRGFYTSGGSTFNLTTTDRTTVMFKAAIGNWQALDPQTTPGFQLIIGSAIGDIYEYDTSIFAAYPPRGGFIIIPIDPNVAGHRDGTQGTPVLTAADVFGINADFSATSKSENVILDAVDHGAGLNLVGGDGASDDGVFQDFVDADEGTVGNRWGFVTSTGGIIFAFGTLAIGINNAGSVLPTVFADTDQTIVFPDGLYDAAWSGLQLDLGHASTDITFTRCTFNGRGSTTTVDTRPVLDCISTTGVALFTDSTFINFASLTLRSVVTIVGGRYQAEAITQNNADISGCTITTTSLTSVATITDPDFTNLADIDFVQGGAGHAIEIDTAGSYSLDGLRGLNVADGGYGANTTDDAALDITAGSGTVTLNILNGGATPTYKTAGATVVIVNAVSVTVTVRDASTSAVIENARVLLEAAAGGDLTAGDDILDALTNASGIVQDTGFAYTSDQPVTGRVRKGTSAPLYKTSPISGTITTAGFDVTIFLVDD